MPALVPPTLPTGSFHDRFAANPKVLYGGLAIAGLGAFGLEKLSTFGINSFALATLGLTGAARIGVHVGNGYGYPLERLGPISDIALVGAAALVASSIIGFWPTVALASAATAVALFPSVKKAVQNTFIQAGGLATKSTGAIVRNAATIGKIGKFVVGTTALGVGAAAGYWAYNNAEHVLSALDIDVNMAWKVGAGILTGMAAAATTGVTAIAALMSAYQSPRFVKKALKYTCLLAIAGLAIGAYVQHTRHDSHILQAYDAGLAAIDRAIPGISLSSEVDGRVPVKPVATVPGDKFQVGDTVEVTKLGAKYFHDVGGKQVTSPLPKGTDIHVTLVNSYILKGNAGRLGEIYFDPRDVEAIVPKLPMKPPGAPEAKPTAPVRQ